MSNTRQRILLPSLECVRELFTYDQVTGILTARIARPKLRAGDVVGTANSKGYLICRVDYKIYYVHRIVWLYHYMTEPPNLIDHINGDKRDNSINNLREATTFQNRWNSEGRRTSRSGIKGAHWSSKKQKWRSVISRKGKATHLGQFDTKEGAANAYRTVSQVSDGVFSVFERPNI